ncbi:MAG: prepilin-type N-terminal cleavage/methylation domain-containing protein [Phycisphaeraceae bacterium]|nr:prepilin-type N-terminal cleavage/methylation domain-containing protein [Phycisphaeraceae bacterium]MCW5753336.1 prepilin-type N-terminal cleavage/methylation domain-containing protein [Phycisphaeraceae bacterium]
MVRRGFTILELLIVLGLLGAIAAIVLPAVGGRTAAYSFDEAVRQVRSAVGACRADARRTGKPVELLAAWQEDGRVMLVGLVVQSERDEEPLDVALFGGLTLEGVSSGMSGDQSMLLAGRRYATLPRTTSIRLREDLAEIADMYAELDEAFVPEPTPARRGRDVRRPVSLGIFMPDGSFLAGEAVEVVGSDGRAGRLRVHPWTGGATIEMRRLDAAAGEEDDARFDIDLTEPFGGEADRERAPAGWEGPQ